MNILISDSNDEVISALRLVLEQKHGYTISGEAKDLISLFSSITQHCPDVLILDADIHGLKPFRGESKNGFTKLLDTLHQLCPSINVIALSSQPYLEQNCLQAGVNAFACKSDPPDKLLGLLNNLSYKK
ncbi:MAG: response regulator [Anaerolineaceae bacterium]|nr:response regulator [Anaerolineaceae bacterium]